MARSKDIADELAGIGPELARLDLSHPYVVPAGYFDSLADDILLRIGAERAASSPKEELELLSPLLSGMNKRMPFSTPEGYFENLAAKVRIGEKEEKGGKVVGLFDTKNVFRYAAAAVVAGVIALSTWFMLKQPEETVNQYALNTDSSIQKDLQKKVSELSENEIASFIENGSGIFTFENSVPGVEINEDDVLLMLADISDQELEKYLDQNTLKEKFN